jgi:plastocyanin
MTFAARHAWLLAVIPLLALGPGEAAAPKIHTVVMANMRFGPMPADLKAGDTIVWVNRDLVPHTATSRPGGFDIRLDVGARARMTVRQAGSFPVVCRYHPGMRAMLKVSG